MNKRASFIKYLQGFKTNEQQIRLFLIIQ